MEIYLNLLYISLIPIFVSAIFDILVEKTSFGKLPYWARQLITGLVFGFVSICGTAFGANIGGATINVRDAGPLCAGLVFGGPAGIIAGVIGGVHRWIFAATAGMYTRVACSVSTILAGLYSAFLHKFLFEKRPPQAIMGAITGVVMEAIHMTLVFVTHLSDAEKAFTIVKICTVPMMLCNGFSVFGSVLLISIIHKKVKGEKNTEKKISEKIHRMLLLTVLIAFLLTSAFVFIIQTNIADTETINQMTLALDDIKESHLSSMISYSTLASSRHIGNEGYVIYADEGNMSGLEKIGVRMHGNSGEYISHTSKVNGVDSFWMYSKVDTGVLVSVVPKSQAYDTRDSSTYFNSYMELLVFATLYILIYLLIKAYVVDGIHSVNKSLKQIIDGDLDTKVDVHSSSEFTSLSNDINSTVDTMKKLIDAEAKRLDAELELAKKIQASALPPVKTVKDFKEFNLFATMRTAKEVGGDFYDFYVIDGTKLVFLIADVSGKGIPAAMFMMNAKSTIKGLVDVGFSPEEAFTHANSKLCEENDAGMFVTAWMGCIDLVTGHVDYVNAGHNPPLLCNNGQYEYLKSKAGFVLAGIDGYHYKLQSFDMQPGESILLYTDGVTEATDSADNLYGEDRLLKLMNDNTEKNPEEYISLINSDIDIFVGEAEQFDDITMIMIRYNEKEMRTVEKTFPADVKELDNALAFVQKEAEKADCTMKTSMQLSVAFEELFVNVGHYAYPDGNGDVTIEVTTGDGNITISLKDHGIPFNPLEKADPDITLSADDRAIGGLGIFMVKKTMDDVRYRYEGGYNILTIVKKL